MLEWREATAATMEVPVLVDELEAEVVAAEVKLRAVRTTPRPTTDENIVLLVIVKGGLVLLQAKRGVGASGGGCSEPTRDVRQFLQFRLTGAGDGWTARRPFARPAISLSLSHHDKPPTCRRFDCWA